MMKVAISSICNFPPFSVVRVRAFVSVHVYECVCVLLSLTVAFDEILFTYPSMSSLPLAWLSVFYAMSFC